MHGWSLTFVWCVDEGSSGGSDSEPPDSPIKRHFSNADMMLPPTSVDYMTRWPTTWLVDHRQESSNRLINDRQVHDRERDTTCERERETRWLVNERQGSASYMLTRKTHTKSLKSRLVFRLVLHFGCTSFRTKRANFHFFNHSLYSAPAFADVTYIG
jgi:hypothetical protein